MKDKRSKRNTKQFRKKVAERQSKARRRRLLKDSVIKYNPVTGTQEMTEYKNMERNFLKNFQKIILFQFTSLFSNIILNK